MAETDLLKQMAVRDQLRFNAYPGLLDFYNGKQWLDDRKWLEKQRYYEKHLVFNYAKIFVDKITSYLMAGINFTVEAMEDTPEARARAEAAEKILSIVYDANNLMQLDLETETDCAILGDACYKVTWDEVEQRVRVTAPDIQGIHAWSMGDDISRVWRVASKYTLTPEEAEMLYGSRSSSFPSPSLKTYNSPSSPTNSKLITVIEVWTDSDFELFLDGISIDRKPNPYGFIPFIIFPNLREPKKFWGTSDLTALIEPQRELNRAMSQLSFVLELSGNPIAILENMEQSPDMIVRPGAIWEIPEKSKAYMLDLLNGGGLQQHMNYIELLHRALHDIAEIPREAFGGMNNAISGVAMQLALNPLQQKVQRKRIIRAPSYNRRNRLILDLYERFSPRSPSLTQNSQLMTHNSPRGTGVPACESPSPETYNLKLKTYNSPVPSLLTDNFRLKVVWGQVLPQDQAMLVTNEQILVQTGIHSRRRAMDEVGVKDPEAEFKHWKEEQEQIKQL